MLALRAPQGLDLFGGSAPSVDEAIEAAADLAADEDDRIVFLADLWLDRPATLDRLRAVLEGADLAPAWLLHTMHMVF